MPPLRRQGHGDGLSWLASWLQTHSLVPTLIALQLADVVMGLLCALRRLEISSSASYRGMTKKAGTLIIIAVAFLIEPHAQGLPTGAMTTLFYVVTEAISVIENGARLGIPVPAVIREALSKLRGPAGPALHVAITTPKKEDPTP